MKRLLLLLPLFAFVLGGCSQPQAEVVEIEGVVTLDDKPLDGVKLIFSPDPEKEYFGRSSSGITDENGKYRLKYSGDSPEYGAEVGWHRITILDYKVENSRDNPIPARISKKYATAGKTDLTYEVKSGESQNDVNFKIDPRK